MADQVSVPDLVQSLARVWLLVAASVAKGNLCFNARLVGTLAAAASSYSETAQDLVQPSL